MLPLIPLILLARLAFATDVATFTDASCKNSFRNLSGPNGYPNGTCTRLDRQGSFGSFQVVGLDSGCAVTIYEKDTTSDPCSGAAIVAEVATCYNASYVYYSIDMCETPSATGGLSSARPSSPSSATTTITATVSSIPASSPTSSSTSRTGAIAGGIVGGVVVLGLAIFGLFFYMRRKKRIAEQTATGDEKRVHEMHAVHTQELPAGGGAGGELNELSAENAGDNGIYKSKDTKHVYQEPVELPVQS